MQLNTRHQHLDGIDEIVVDPDDVIELLRRNDRDQTQPRSHVFRISPPFEGSKHATTHVSEQGNFYPPDMDPKPLHIDPAVFIIGDEYGSNSSNWSDELYYPHIPAQRGYFRDENDLYDEHGEPIPLDEDPDISTQWDAFLDTVLDIWESDVRSALDKVDSIAYEGPSRTKHQHVDVRFEDFDVVETDK